MLMAATLPSGLRPWGPDNPPPKSPGRPRKRPISEAYDDMVRNELPEEIRRSARMPKGSTWADAIALQMARQALKGEVPAAKEIREAIEGKAMQRIELSRSEEKPAELMVVYATAIPGERKKKEMERVLEAVATITDESKEE